MSYRGHGLRLGATFTPGGFDDFQVPPHSAEVISPAPQRIMQELPGHIQDGVASLALDGRNGLSEGPRRGTPQEHSPNHIAAHAGSQASQQRASRSPPRILGDEPNSSAFPKLHDRTPNIPPSADEKEALLDRARLHVLGSTDPEVQLAWAQDVLGYIDISLENERRLSQVEHVRQSQVAVQIRGDALSIVQFLADQEHPRALFIKGMWLEFGKFNFTQDRPEAFRCYKRAAARGYIRAEYRMGMQYEFTNEPTKALQHYRAGEALGDAASCYRMGMMSLLGQLGQPQDFLSGVRLIQQAADGADENAPQGAYVFGMLQARELPQITVPDIYLPLDLYSARQSIEKAAYFGFSKAQLKMASAYELCTLGCEFSPTLSIHYNALAARQGEAEAEMSISKWFLCGYEGLFPKNEEIAFKYARRAATTGLPTAEFAMGYFHEIGMYVPADLVKAVEWYERAAKDGNWDARGRIDGISKSRTLSRRDHENVALSRIKSQHGSRRGARPDRLTKPTTPMPSIPDEMAQNPALQSYEQTTAWVSAQTSTADTLRPQRSSSITPYPLDEGHEPITPFSQKKSGPLSDQGPGPLGGFLNVNMDDRPFSAMVEGRFNPPNGHRPEPQPTLGGGGRGAPSSWATPSPQTHTGRQSSDSVSEPSLNDLQAMNATPPNQDRLDIGFSAPSDPRAISRTRANGAAVRGMRGQEPRRSSGGSSRVQPQPPRGSATSSPSAGLGPGRSSPTGNIGAGSPSKPGTVGAPGSRVSNLSQAGGAAQPLPNGPAKVPGRGPQTFEEMGVPVGKQENDCMIM